ncbi:hypothetical protein BGZ65_006290 [Modicella reniformis]|uniref:Protein-S-isoprenylcysteine O-methyltransferase n=1 Tax=Modicella reniformis TaxID=1440133 RepID=A0A9P6LSJ1_9FUNG|nr:hypothetical protein BGZ65_006290 [Modicella reniformis]
MLAKAVCISLHTAAIILSIRPPTSSKTKEKSDKVKDEGLFLNILLDFVPRFGQSAAAIATAFYILMMSQGYIAGELEPWQVLTTVAALMLAGIPYAFSMAYKGYWTFLIKPYMVIPIPGSVLMIMGLIICYGVMALRVQGEEKMLSQHFGSEWKQHVSTRWRFIPFVL